MHLANASSPDPSATAPVEPEPALVVEFGPAVLAGPALAAVDAEAAAVGLGELAPQPAGRTPLKRVATASNLASFGALHIALQIWSVCRTGFTFDPVVRPGC
jgi:hypothetical protein